MPKEQHTLSTQDIYNKNQIVMPKMGEHMRGMYKKKKKKKTLPPSIRCQPIYKINKHYWVFVYVQPNQQ